jgi:hypothetical protein
VLTNVPSSGIRGRCFPSCQNGSIKRTHWAYPAKVLALNLLVVGGRCTGRARRCKAKQDRRGKTALI